MNSSYVAPSTPSESGREVAPTSTGITREQFIRGIDTINRYRQMVDAVGKAMIKGGCVAPDDIGGDDLLKELTRQIEERCNDADTPYGSMVSYMLYDCGGPVVLDDGRRFMVDTPELLWAYWKLTGNGPFSDGDALASSTLDTDADRNMNNNNLPERAKP